MNNHKWYVIQVKNGCEESVAKELQKRGFSAVVPIENRVIRRKGKWVQQLYVVFTGYVFIYMNYNWSKYYAMSGIHGIIKILGGGQSPIPLSKDEVLFILKLSELLEKPSEIHFDSDSDYRIVSGFLLDYEDKIIKIERRYKRAEVLVTVAGEEKEIKVSFIEAEQMPEQTED